MNISTIAACALSIPMILHADERGTLIFEDDFERTESQETKDEVGNKWTTNSASRAKGNKQVDLKDGAMHIYRHEVADHGVSVRQDADFKDGAVTLRFMLENSDDSLGLDFGDAQLKTVHAGHLFKVTIGVSKLEIADTKTGVMSNEIHTLKKAGKLSPEIQQMLASKTKRFPLKLKTGKWYSMDIDIKGDTLRVAIDGQEAGSFASEGFAHPTKRMLRLAVPKKAVVDDLKIFSTAAD
jgi:hypothetical protein